MNIFTTVVVDAAVEVMILHPCWRYKGESTVGEKDSERPCCCSWGDVLLPIVSAVMVMMMTTTTMMIEDDNDDNDDGEQPCSNEYKQGIELKGRIKGNNQASQGRQVEERRERSYTFIQEPDHSIQEHTQKEKRENCCLLSCHTRLRTILILYPWRGDYYSSSIIKERRGRCRGIIIIRMGPIRRHIIHCVRHTILIQHHHKWSLHCPHPCIKSSVPTWHYHRTINSITH